MPDNTVFDSAFKTLVHKEPRLIVPFINEAFGRRYPDDATVIQFNSEHETERGTIIDDSVFRVEDKIYHIECQSTPEANMIIRMIEYDFSIALEQALVAGAPYRLEFPASCVLFLRHTSRTPDELTMEVALPDGRSFDYKVKVVKAQQFSSQEIFEKRLLLLLPYYLMRYERELAKIARSDERTRELLLECSNLRLSLETTVLAAGETMLYEELIELIMRVSDHLLASHEMLQKKVRATMGGEILELWHDRAERIEREAREEGLAQGRELGLEQGLEQGRELGLEQGLEQGRELGLEEGIEQGLARGLEKGRAEAAAAIANRLIALGVDRVTIEQAIGAAKSGD